MTNLAETPDVAVDHVLIDPRLGDVLCQHLERETGKRCHIVLIVMPIEAENEDDHRLGQPSFVTSLSPDDTEHVVRQIADSFDVAGQVMILDAMITPESLQ
jgi:hypothetical protein